jgi:hypothetical protein
MPYRLRLNLYNSGGERVLQLFDGTSQYAQSELKVSASSLAVGSGDKIAFVFWGALEGLPVAEQSRLYWAGENDAGQLVGGGIYYAKLEVEDSYGAVKTYVQELAVLRVTHQQRLTVYNSAGEAVAHLAAPGGPGSRLLVENSSQAFAMDPITGAVMGGITIKLLGGLGGDQTLQWQGLNDFGVPVAPGSYTLELASEDPGGSILRQTQTVVLLKAPMPLGLASAVLGPSPWRGEGPLRLQMGPLPAGDGVRVRVYNAAAELVLQESFVAGVAAVDLEGVDKLASGVYLVELTWTRSRAVMERRVLKLAVAR